MPTNRFQFSDDFVLNNGNVGINSSSPQEKLDVVGVVKGQDLKVTGVSSFTTYEGFLNSNQNIVENVSISNGSESGSLSGEIIVGTGVTVTVGSAATSSQGYIDSLKVYNTFTVPTGGTEDRPSKVKPGQLYYNVDFKTIEFWDGNNWRQVDYTTQSGRGVFAGGRIAPAVYVTNVDYINISSTGNALSFGTLTTSTGHCGGCSSETRGVFAGGGPVGSNVIEYITIASEGNPIDFGDLTLGRTYLHGSCSSSTRGLWLGGEGPAPSSALQNIIDYVQISTIGNAIDFGDLRVARIGNYALSSPTRGITAGGQVPSTTNLIEFITISSKGNATDFGFLGTSNFGISGCSNSTRGIWGGGSNPSYINTISYITISSTGNAIDFGNLTLNRAQSGSCSNSIRGVFAGGNNPALSPIDVNLIDYVLISSGGQAQDFGDLTAIRRGFASMSDSHGGLGGF